MSILLLLKNTPASVLTTFLEPGGDATFNSSGTGSGGFWSGGGQGVIATDFVHGSHLKSIKYTSGTTQQNRTSSNTVSDLGTRLSCYFYFVAYPTAQNTFFACMTVGGASFVVEVRISTAGVVKLFVGGSSTQIGSDGPTLNLSQWYRVSLAYSITSSTYNDFRLFIDGALVSSGTNVTLLNTTSSISAIGNSAADATLDFRSSDHYIDNSNSLLDTGDIWVTAKRPNANGTTNGFTTQIGVGGSGYGTGHSPQVNERALSTTNGWSMVGAGAAITEEYNIEGKATGDTNITTGTIIDYMGWVSAKALVAAGANIKLNGVSTAISLTTAATVFTKMAGSTTYPAGTGSDIGIITDTTLTTVSLYEAGIIVAYIPGATGGNNNQRFMLMGVG